MARTLAHNGRAHRDSGGVFAALLVVALLAVAVLGAWKLGVMAGDQADWRQSLPELSRTLRSTPNPQPPPLPTQQRPTVAERSTSSGL